MEEVAFSCYHIKMEQIKKYNLNEFENSVCIELLNYLNSAIYQEIENEKSNERPFLEYCEKLFSHPETEHALKIVRERTNYRTPYIKYMLNYDFIGLEDYERKIFRKQRKKRIIKKFLMLLR